MVNIAEIEGVESAEDVERSLQELEEEIKDAEQAREEISETAVPQAETIGDKKAPRTIDLFELSSEEKLKRQQWVAEKYKDVLARVPGVGKKLETTEGGYIEDQDIGFDQLVFIRADDYPPDVTEGELRVLNAHDATDGRIPRITNHFTLNHRVTSNNGGSWENRHYQFIIPGQAMAEVNGNPDNLYSIDSFWTKSVKLPKGTVIIYAEGKKPTIPEDLEDDIVLIERDSVVNDAELISLVLERMGYSKISGGGWSASPGYEKFDKGVQRLADKEKLSSGVHFGSWSEILEETNMTQLGSDYEQGRRQLLRLYDKNKSEELRRTQQNLKRKAWEDLLGVFKVSKKDYPGLRRKVKKLFGEYTEEEFTDEAIDRRVKEGREKIGSFIGDIVEGGRHTQKEKAIPKEECAFILRLVPIEAWQHLVDQMKQSLSEGIYQDIDEVRSKFMEYFAVPYEETTGDKLAVEALKF